MDADELIGAIREMGERIEHIETLMRRIDSAFGNVAKIKIKSRCKTTGCEEEAFCRGLCSRHYQHWRMHRKKLRKKVGFDLGDGRVLLPDPASRESTPVVAVPTADGAVPTKRAILWRVGKLWYAIDSVTRTAITSGCINRERAEQAVETFNRVGAVIVRRGANDDG